MCSPAKCPSCGKTTWAGCGAHVDEVMSMVPAERQCTCISEQRASTPARPGLLARLLSR